MACLNSQVLIECAVMANKFNKSYFYNCKQQGQKFAAVSCYDYTFAKLAAAAGVEMLLVGDSAAQLMLGFDSTASAGTEFMIAITAAVRRAGQESFVVADMPYESSLGLERLIMDSRRFVDEAGADIVKIETSAEQADRVKAVIDAGISVMPHLGIRPQTGKYKAEATSAADAVELIELAMRMDDAGADMLLLEGAAREVAGIITERVSVPVVSCGSGPECDGQVLILPDILGLTAGAGPKFAKSFGRVGDECAEAIGAYVREVGNGSYPDDAHSYHMKSGELDKLKSKLGLQ